MPIGLRVSLKSPGKASLHLPLTGGRWRVYSSRVLRRVGLLCALVVALPTLGAAADGQGPTPNMFAPVSTPAFAIREIAYFVLGINGVIFLIVGGMIVYTIVRFRRRAADRPSEPPQV